MRIIAIPTEFHIHMVDDETDLTEETIDRTQLDVCDCTVREIAEQWCESMGHKLIQVCDED